MMQLICSGQRLDMKEGSKLQLKRTNILFAFDKAEVERSLSFDLPATPTNNVFFAFSGDPHTAGTGMRGRYACQLQADGVTMDGYLYVTSYSKGSYKVVFTTGDLLGLQTLRDAGKLPEILSYDNVVDMNSWSYPYPNRAELFKRIYYKTSAALMRPSVRLSTLAEDALTQLGVAHTLPTDYTRIIVGLNGIQSEDAEFQSVRQRPVATGGTVPVCATALLSGYDGLENVFGEELHGIEFIEFATMQTYDGQVKELVPRQNISLTFPDDWDDDVYVGGFATEPTEYVYQLGIFQFLGDRSFDEDGQATGESLRGRTVEIPAGQGFTFINIADYIDEASGGVPTRQGWFWNSANLACDFTVEGDEVQAGQYVRLQDNLPDVSVIELLRTLAAIHGKVVYYTAADGVTLDDLDVATWSAIDITEKTVSADNVQRAFGNFAQRNAVEFDSGDGVLTAEKITAAYEIQNANLEKESTLQTVPFSEGGAEGTRVYVRDDEETLADADTADSYMQRVTLTKNAGLQALCVKSTSVEVQARMTLAEYRSITPKTLILAQGLRCVWTSMQWSDGVAKMSLSAV